MSQLQSRWRSLGQLFRIESAESIAASPSDFDPQDKQIVASSGLFDPNWYLARYPDAVEAGLDPVDHYLRYGAIEHRSPGPDFDAAWYLDQNPDVATANLNPLVHFIRYGSSEGRLPRPPSHAEKYLFKAATPQSTGAVIIRNLQAAPPRLPTDAPAPPPQLMEYAETAEKHLEMGKADFELLHGILEESSMPFSKANRILDFGCSNARITRWMIPFADRAEIWGVDLQADKIFWATENLSPPLRFLTNTVVPHLPFPDNGFSLVIAQSVFTHIVELHGSWLMELVRILEPGGVMFVTLNDEPAFSADPEFFAWIFRGLNDQLKQTPFARLDFAAINPYGNEGLAHVYISERYLRKFLPRSLELERVVPRAFGPGQTGYVIRKIKAP